MRQGMLLAVLCALGLAPLDAGPVMAVRLRLTTATDLPAGVRGALVGEATTIWRRAGVDLRWESPQGGLASGLRVLVVHRPPPLAGEEEAWPVGELVLARQPAATGETLSVPIAFVSIEASQRILARAGLPAEPERLTEQRLGVVLGRAVAHEIGHYLLSTPTHAPSGLMRARIAAADFADLRGGAFFLDRRASRWLRTGEALASGAAGPPGFRYTTP